MQIEFSEEKQDAGAEALERGETAGGVLEALNDRIDPFSRRIGDAMIDIVENAFAVIADHFRDFIHGF